MEFCPICNSLQEIIQDVDNTIQSGGVQYESVIKNILLNLNNKDNLKKIISNIEIKDIIKSTEYTSLPLDKQELLYNMFQELLPRDKKKISTIIKNKSDKYDIYYKCNDCNFSQQIKPGTLIYSETVNKEESPFIDLSHLIDDPLYPRTKNYTCINKDCESHTTSNKLALFKRTNDKKQFICEICKHQWIQ